MLISNSVVHNCPITRASQGRLTLSREFVADVAGAVGDSNEWAVFLLGERSSDGFDVTVDGWQVVEGQRRTGADVDWQHLGGAVPQPDRCVGVMHSHHSMGAFFSHKDRTELNPRFPVSIVVASDMPSDEARWLGWSYQAEGKVKLPCGALGRVRFEVNVSGILQGEVWLAADDEGFGDCAHIVEVPTTAPQYNNITGQCGLIEKKMIAVEARAGRTPTLLAALPPVEVIQRNLEFTGFSRDNKVLPTGRKLADKLFPERTVEMLARFNELDARSLHHLTDEEFDEYEVLEAELWAADVHDKSGKRSSRAVGWSDSEPEGEDWQDEWMERYASEILSLEGGL